MIEIPQTQFHLLTPFFNKSTPNLPMVLSILEGQNPGRAWVDKPENPTTCLVITNGTYSFIGKTTETIQTHMLEIIELLKSNKPIKLIWTPSDPYTSLFINAGFTPQDRIQFNNPAIAKGDTTLIDTLCKSLPKDCKIKSIDENTLKKSHWLSYINLFYGNEDNFIKKGYGLALIKNNEIISEAYACFIGGGQVETGSVTSEKERGKGYATLVRAFLIKESMLRNLEPITSCSVENIASAKASDKLGFKKEINYQFLML